MENAREWIRDSIGAADDAEITDVRVSFKVDGVQLSLGVEEESGPEAAPKKRGPGKRRGRKKTTVDVNPVKRRRRRKKADADGGVVGGGLGGNEPF